MRTLRFYFDYLSPYAYLAWTQVHALGVEVEPHPILFAALLDANGTRGPAEVPARRRYIIRDLARIAHRFGVPLVAPPAHPFNPLLALRVTALDMPAAQRRALIDALYGATWATGQGITDPEVVQRIASELGLPVDAVARAQSAEIKARIRANTDDAIARGMFGVPTMLVDDQMFWGCDSLPHLAHYLAHGDVVPAEMIEIWERLPAAAVRTRASG
ncbi:MAG TPA: 2-hydroxychromene-2-carboxylate isomerase [Kofleriaceae bacterium]|nr:2-hydroxychromene-2-carboxylate isomerase [Kofleriaceae bacterium]